MAAVIYLDTHVVAWLYAQGRQAVPGDLADRIEATDDLRISPMVRLELQYLYEIDRVAQPALPVLDALESALGLVICKAAFPAVVREAEANTWTRAPFDRLIVAQAAPIVKLHAPEAHPALPRDKSRLRPGPGTRGQGESGSCRVQP